MGGFDRKVLKFIEYFIDKKGYVRVLEGLENTLTIAVLGLIIGTLIGILIASVRVMPKYISPHWNKKVSTIRIWITIPRHLLSAAAWE